MRGPGVRHRPQADSQPSAPSSPAPNGTRAGARRWADKGAFTRPPTAGLRDEKRGSKIHLNRMRAGPCRSVELEADPALGGSRHAEPLSSRPEEVALRDCRYTPIVDGSGRAIRPVAQREARLRSRLASESDSACAQGSARRSPKRMRQPAMLPPDRVNRPIDSRTSSLVAFVLPYGAADQRQNHLASETRRLANFPVQDAINV